MAISVERDPQGKPIVINTNHVAVIRNQPHEDEGTCLVEVSGMTLELMGTMDELVRRLMLNQGSNHYSRNLD